MLVSGKQHQTIKESDFCKSLVPEKFILPAVDGWWNWGMAPIYDEKGKLHVFMSTIPYSGSWVKDSKIVHFVADSPKGPYEFVDTTFSSHTVTYHNPQVSKVGDTYVLVYLIKDKTTPRVQQQIGIATTKSLDDPWVESPHNPIIRASGKMDNANIIHASNPTFLVDAEGKYRIYYKSITDKYKPKQYREISLAISDNIEGPYENYKENPLITYADRGLDIEDPYAFYYKGMYYMIVEDRMDVKSALEGNPSPQKEIELGGNRPGLIYKSKDGINWERPEVAYKTNSFYFDVELARTERPNILWKDGQPECLYLACHDDDPTAGFFLKIEGWEEAENNSKKYKLPISKDLTLDLNADLGVTVEEDRMVTTWTNQAPYPKAVDFKITEEGRTKTIITQQEIGTGRPTLSENKDEINGHNSLIFRENELINANDQAFHGMLTGGGYTWFAVIKPYKQAGPGKINSKYPNAFFGCLRNSGPPQSETGQYAGFWGSFYPDGRVYMGSRNGLNVKVRDGVNTPEVEGPSVSINEWHIIMGRQGSGQDKVLLELFVDDPSEAVNSSDFPVGDVEPSRMAIGTERNAINHMGKESFDGELARLLMFETALNGQEMKEVYGYLRNLYFE
jgi:hypothetical protein